MRVVGGRGVSASYQFFNSADSSERPRREDGICDNSSMKLTRLPRPVVGWAFYDFANSAYSTTIMAVVFSVYFAKSVVPADGWRWGGWLIPGESLWGYIHSAVMATVMLVSTSLGAIADARRWKRPMLIVFAVAGASCAMALGSVLPGDVSKAILLTFAATACFEIALLFYNAFLNEIAAPADTGRVSGLGFAFGYIGGGLCLALNLWMIARPAAFGDLVFSAADPTRPIRASVFVAGVWWLIFSLPTFLWVRDAPGADDQRRPPAAETVRSTLSQLRITLSTLFQMTDLKRFVLAYLFYNDGIQTVLLMASIFGAKALGLSAAELGGCYLMVQFVAFFGASACGRWADAWSHRNVVLTTIGVYLGVLLWAMVMRSAWEFWALAAVVGLVLGGSQAASRSLYALLIPAPRAGEFFGLFSVVGKASALLGPFVFGLAAQLWGLRAAIGSLLAFFVIGGALLALVDERRGKHAAAAPQ